MQFTDLRCSSAAPAALVPSYSAQIEATQASFTQRDDAIRILPAMCQGHYKQLFLIYHAGWRGGWGKTGGGGNSFLLVGSEGVDDKALINERKDEVQCRNVAASRHKSFFCNVLRALKNFSRIS